MSEVLHVPDLCVPRPGSTTLRTVLSAALRRALQDLRAVLGVHASGPMASDVAAFARVVGPLARTRPGALAAAVRRTEVGVWLRCLRPGAAQAADPAADSAADSAVDPAVGVPSLLATLGLELARTGELPQRLRLRAWPPWLSSCAGRLALRMPADATGLVLGPGWAAVERPGGEQALALQPDDAAYVPLRGSEVRLALHDDNPLAALEAHPDKHGNALDLGGQPVARWCEALERALATIERYLPAFRAEIELVLQRVVPVGWDAHQHRSATVQEALGTVYLSLHPNPMTMVEALVHEVSHNKIAALLELDPVLHDAHVPIHASPVRPDPRPLHGVLLAVHAFLPVAALYAAMIEAGAPGAEHPDFRRRLAEIVDGNREGTRVLREHARPTAVGRQLLDEIEALDGGAGPSRVD
ncbi:MAG: hypothetical protein KDK70_08305 [Myxococcales bacterium]|nr:hypothetical protein [Myxococcales bacterium]